MELAHPMAHESPADLFPGPGGDHPALIGVAGNGSQLGIVFWGYVSAVGISVLGCLAFERPKNVLGAMAILHGLWISFNT